MIAVLLRAANIFMKQDSKVGQQLVITLIHWSHGFLKLIYSCTSRTVPWPSGVAVQSPWKTASKEEALRTPGLVDRVLSVDVRIQQQRAAGGLSIRLQNWLCVTPIDTNKYKLELHLLKLLFALHLQVSKDNDDSVLCLVSPIKVSWILAWLVTYT